MGKKLCPETPGLTSETSQPCQIPNYHLTVHILEIGLKENIVLKKNLLCKALYIVHCTTYGIGLRY